MAYTIPGIELARATVVEYIACINNDCNVKITPESEETP
jgi:hypothetical protein